MKKSISTMCMILIAFFGTAQMIDKVEFFWDNDPGVGQGLVIDITPVTNLNQSFNIDPAGLKAGIHYLGCRTHLDNGKWSIPQYSRVVVHAIIEAEYFWDEDPGVGNGNPLALETESLEIDESFEISTVGLFGGWHTLGIRTRGLMSSWSPVTTKEVYVNQAYSDGEYFWDNDPGVGNGVSFDLPNDQGSLDVTVEVNNVGLEPGVHYLYSRLRAEGGSFGPLNRKRIYIAEQVVGAEYFWDIDPGVGNGTPLGTLSIGSTAQICDDISTVGIEDGLHYLYVRTVSEKGTWSIPTRIEMTITPNEILVGCAADFDRDGAITAADLLTFLSAFGTSGDCVVDLDGDFVVGASDLLVFLSLFGTTCE